jgi:hypothetical protein
MKRKWTAALLALVFATGAGRESWAWGATGHEWISGIAIETLPDSLPGFVRSPEAAAEIAVMGRELDRSKGSGRTHDAERDPGHWILLADAPPADYGAVMGVLPLAELPPTRREYDTLLRAKGFDQYQAGYLPYSIVDGWQQIRKDFAYWRAAVKGAETAATPEERAWFEADRRLREKLTLRDIGIWSHYDGDATQPLHVSVHISGWGNFANPDGYSARDFHPYFEGEFVKTNLVRAEVAAEVGPYRACDCSIEARTRALLLASLAEVGPLYALEKDGGLKPGDPRGIALCHDAPRRRRHRRARHDRRGLAAERRYAGRLSHGQSARHREWQGQGDARSVRGGLGRSLNNDVAAARTSGNPNFRGDS